jgi:uncharacterized protein YigA (DUF484 family)
MQEVSEQSIDPAIGASMASAIDRSAAPGLVAEYLRAHPDFLAARPELYRVLVPPQRVHGEALADHMTAMVRIERAHAAAQEERAATVLHAGRAAAGIADRVHEAALALIAAPDLADCVSSELPHLLGVDAAALCCETFRPRWRSLPPGAVAMLMRGKNVVCRDRPADAALLHAEAALLAERDVLVRLPGAVPAILALVSRDPASLPALQATQSFAFLGRLLGTLLSR